MKRKVFLIAAILLWILAANASSYTIHIAIKGLPGSSNIILKDFETNTDINTITLVNGKGILTGKLQNGPRLLFAVIPVAATTLWCNFMIGNEEVWLTAATTDFPYMVKLTGSPTQDIFYSLNVLLAHDRIRRDSILSRAKLLLADTASKPELRKLAREMAVIDSMEIIIKKNFIQSHLQSDAAVLELFLLRSAYEKAMLQALYTQLTPQLQETAYGIKIKHFLDITKIIEKGDTAFSFTASDKEGNMHYFPQLNGKYILLNFTKAYCSPCVQSVKELEAVSRTYPTQLQVVSFSVDKKQDWLQTLKQDKPSWLCLSDGKGYAGPVTMHYGVQSYPTFVLIDPAGKVVAKESGYSINSIRELIAPCIK